MRNLTIQEQLAQIERRARIADYCGCVIFAVILALTLIILGVRS
jgi:hypothetical protein